MKLTRADPSDDKFRKGLVALIPAAVLAFGAAGGECGDLNPRSPGSSRASCPVPVRLGGSWNATDPTPHLRRGPQTPRVYLYQFVFILNTFKPQSPSKLSVRCKAPIETLSARLKAVFELVGFDALQGFCHVLCRLFHISNEVLTSRTSFIWGNTKATWGEVG